MARRYEITNRCRGPRGFHTVDKGSVVITRHDTDVLTVDGDTEKLILKMADAGELEAIDLGAVDPLDHDRDGKKGGAVKPAAERQRQPASGDELDALRTERDALKAEVEDLKAPKTFNVGPNLTAVLADAGIENLADLQAALDVIEEALEPITIEGRPETLAEAQARYDATPDERKAAAFPEGRPQAPAGTDGSDGPAAASEVINEARPAEYAESMDFATLDDAQLRAFIKQATGSEPHPATKTPKLLEKARAADREQWEEAQASLKAGGRSADEVEEAV